MAIVFPGMQKDSLGGPGGSTQNALMQMLQIFSGQQQQKKQQEQMSLLAQIFQGEKPQLTRGAGGQMEYPDGVPNVPQNTAQQMIEKLLSSGITDPNVMNTGFNAISAMPKTEKPNKIKMTHPKTGQSVEIPENSPLIAQLQQRGFEMGTFPASTFEKEDITLTNPKTGQSVKTFAGSPLEAQLTNKGFVRGTFPASTFKPEDTGLQSPIGKEIEDLNKLKAIDPNNPDIKLIENSIIKKGAQSGQTITLDAEGNLTISTGPQGQKISRRTQGTIEEKLIGTQQTRLNAERILSEFNPEFLTYYGKTKNVLFNVRDKLKGTPIIGDLAELNPEQKDFVSKMSTFRQDAIEAINMYIKEITGAQMSEKEADRLRKAVADAGDGIFSGDGPQMFISKLNNSIEKGKLAEARFLILRENGLSGQLNEDALQKAESVYSDARVKKIVGNFANDYADSILVQNPEISDDELSKLVKAEIKKKYGL